jgi:hypothetical protein
MPEISAYFNGLHGGISQKAVNFIFADVRTLNLTGSFSLHPIAVAFTSCRAPTSDVSVLMSYIRVHPCSHNMTHWSRFLGFTWATTA